MLPGLLADYSIAGAVGAPYDEAIPVSGIREGDIILAVMASAPGADPLGLNPGDFESANGTITSETQDTEGYKLTVIWAPVSE